MARARFYKERIEAGALHGCGDHSNSFSIRSTNSVTATNNEWKKWRQTHKSREQCVQDRFMEDYILQPRTPTVQQTSIKSTSICSILFHLCCIQCPVHVCFLSIYSRVPFKRSTIYKVKLSKCSKLKLKYWSKIFRVQGG
jgi:hypothetical protein